MPRRQKPVSRWFLRRSNDYCLQRIDRAVYADISYLLQWTMTWCIYLLRDNLWFLNNFLTINNKSYTINSTLILSFIKWYKFDIFRIMIPIDTWFYEILFFFFVILYLKICFYIWIFNQIASVMPLIASLIIGNVRKRSSSLNVTATCRHRTEL